MQSRALPGPSSALAAVYYYDSVCQDGEGGANALEVANRAAEEWYTESDEPFTMPLVLTDLDLRGHEFSGRVSPAASSYAEHVTLSKASARKIHGSI
jgi:hypothetical protein